MGRKIPAKKHRGVKDPLEQQAKRLQSLKTKINAPPIDPDDQPVPKSLSRLFGLNESNKSSVKKKKHNQLKHKKDGVVDGGGKGGGGGNPVSRLRRAPGESARDFSLRINNAVRQLHGHVTEEQYPMDAEESDTKGMWMAAQRERREKKRKRNAKQGKGQGEGEEEGPRLGRAAKLALKKKEKMMKAAEKASERVEVQYERVQFGERADAPPALPPPRRVKPDATAPRPGRRELLLSKMLKGASDTNNDSGGKSKSVGKSDGKSGKSGKDVVSAAEKERRERARVAAVLAYRQLKKGQEAKRPPVLIH